MIGWAELVRATAAASASRKRRRIMVSGRRVTKIACKQNQRQQSIALSTKLFGTAKYVALYLRPLSRCGAVGGAPARRDLCHTHACANSEGIAVAKDSSPPEMCVLRGLVLGETTVQAQEVA